VTVSVKHAPRPAFPGFAAFRANVTYVPIQFFTVVIPHSTISVVRIVGYALRQLLGWVDEHGQPKHERLQFTRRELSEGAGVSRCLIDQALKLAVELHFLECVEAPQADCRGRLAHRGTYEICWDKEGPYTDSLAEFRGFFYHVAMVPVPPAGNGRVQPTAARKNIPNDFFDYLLPRERLAVVRVVGALLFYSIQWGDGGERRQPVKLSITRLSRLTGQSRRHVHAAIHAALAAGYIESVTAGYFDPAAGRKSHATTYGVRWIFTRPRTRAAHSAHRGPGAAGALTNGGDGRKVNGECDLKGERAPANKVNGKLRKKVNGMSIKIESKTTNTTAAAPSEVPAHESAGAATAAAAVGLLLQSGFDLGCARRLAEAKTLAVIQRQIEWLPLRHSNRNRLGLLRAAIEGDWPKPEAGGPEASVAVDTRWGQLFAAHYYAGYHGQAGAPTSEPFAKDCLVGQQFVAHLVAEVGGQEHAAEWGRRFGQLVRQHHRQDTRAKPYLTGALTLYGNEFLKLLQQTVAARQRTDDSKAKAAHQATFLSHYLRYLAAAEETLQAATPARYAAFLEHRRATRHLMTVSRWDIPAQVFTHFDSAAGRLQDLVEFFERDPHPPVLSFWRWDKQHNPRPFGTPAEPAPLPAEQP
jgi:hypothetical protein